MKARVEKGHINASDIPGYDDNPDEAAMNFLLNPKTAPIVVAATLHHSIAFINNENGGAWNAKDYPQAVAYFYSSGYGSNGEILQNPQNGNEKIDRAPGEGYDPTVINQYTRQKVQFLLRASC